MSEHEVPVQPLLRKPPLMKKQLAVLSLVGIAVIGTACGKTATVTTTNDPSPVSAQRSTTATTAQSMQSWASANHGDISDVGSDLEAVGTAADAGDEAALRTACRSLQESVATTRTDLPSPNAALNADLGSALNHIDRAATYCIAGDYESASTEIGLANSLITQASADLNATAS